jgi:hypothetical protein
MDVNSKFTNMRSTFFHTSDEAVDWPYLTRALGSDPRSLKFPPPEKFNHLIYCDGACSGNGRANAAGGWGAVITEGSGLWLGHGGQASSTNNRMELTAAIEEIAAHSPTSRWRVSGEGLA